MGKSGIGDSFSDRLRQHEEPIDHNQLIVDMGLESKNQKRPIIWIVLVCLFAGLTAAGLSYGWSQNDIEELSLDTSSDPQLSNTIAFETNELQLSTDVSTDTKSNQKTNKTSVQTTTLSTQKTITSSAATSASNLINESTLEEEIKPVLVKKSSTRIATTPLPADTENQSLLEETPFSKNMGTEPSNTLNTSISKPQSSDDEIVTDVISEEQNEKQFKIEITKPLEAIAVKSDTKNERYLFSESFLDNSTIDFGFRQKDPYAPKLAVTKATDSKLSAWSIAFQSEIFAFQNTINHENIEAQDYAQFRSSSEKPLEGFRNEVLLQYDLSRFMYLKSGLQYTRYNRSFNYQENILESVEENSVTDINVNYFGDTTIVSGIVSSEKNINRYWTRQQHLNQINIPIYLGVYRSSGHWRTYLEAGIHMNLFQWFDGAIMDDNLSIVTDSNIYRSSFANQFSIGAGALYRVNSRMGIDASLQYGRSLNSTTLEQYPLNENIQHMGMRLGIAYRL